MDPYSSYGSLSPLTGAQEERVVGLEETMETSCNLDSIISQMMEARAMSPLPIASTKSVTASMKTLVTASTKTSTCSPLTASMACSSGDPVIHPNHVKKKGLEGAQELTTSLSEGEPFSCTPESPANQIDSRVHIESSNTIEGVALVVDPALAKLPPELKNVDKVIIICNKDNLDTVLNSQTMIPQPELQVPAAKPVQEPLVTQSYQYPEVYEEAVTSNSNENCITICEGIDSMVYQEQTQVNAHASQSYGNELLEGVEENMMTVKEEPAESFSVEQIKEILSTAPSFPQNTVQPEAPQMPSLSVNLPWLQDAPQETLKTPDVFLGNDGSFDLLQYIIKDEDIPVEELPCPSHPTPTNVNPFQFPAVTTEIQVAQPPKRKMEEEEPSTSKRTKVQVTITPQIPSHTPAQKMAIKSKGSSRRSAMSHDETRRKNNIASKRSRDNRRQKQLDNDRLLVELEDTNQKLTKKYESLEKLVETMRELLLKSRWG